MSNIIIGIHGLSNKPPRKELQDGWRDAILEGLKENEGLSSVKLNFESV